MHDDCFKFSLLFILLFTIFSNLEPRLNASLFFSEFLVTFRNHSCPINHEKFSDCRKFGGKKCFLIVFGVSWCD